MDLAKAQKSDLELSMTAQEAQLAACQQDLQALQVEAQAAHEAANKVGCTLVTGHKALTKPHLLVLMRVSARVKDAYPVSCKAVVWCPLLTAMEVQVTSYA